MAKISTPVTVEWEDCDPAGIVFYPKFFAFFDQSTWNIFYEVGLTWEIMKERYGAVGIPIVDAHAQFRYPCRFKDRLIVTSTVTEWKHRTIKVSHVIHNGEHEAVQGYEIRIWGVPHPEDPRRLQTALWPDEVVATLKGELPAMQ